MPNGRGDIAHLGSCRPGLKRHGFQHLRGNDNRHASLQGFVDDLLLNDRDVLKRNFHAEVASSDHDGVRNVENAFQVFKRHRVFYFGQNGHVHRSSPHRFLGRKEVCCRADVAHSDAVGAVFQGVIERQRILGSNGRQVHQSAGNVHPFPTADGSPVNNGAAHLAVSLTVGCHNLQANEAIGQQDGVSRFDFRRQSPVLNRKIGPVGAFDVKKAAVKRDLCAVLQHVNLWKIAKAKFWSGKVGKNARGSAHLVLDISHPAIEFRLVFGVAVRVVEPADINTRLQQRFQGWSVAGCWTDGGHDSRAAHDSHPVFHL